MKNKLGIFVFTWLFLSSLLVVSIGQQPSIHPISPIHGDFDLWGDFYIRKQNEIRFYDADNSHYVGWKAQSASGTQIWQLPTADGTNGQVLRTNGGGVLSWASAAAGSGVIELDDDDASNILTGQWGENDDTDRTWNILVNSGDRILSLEGDAYLDQDYTSDSTVRFARLELSDSNATHWVTIDWNEDDVADRQLRFQVNGADRTVALSGNLTVGAASTINQDVSTTADPTFDDATVDKIEANECFTFDAVQTATGDGTTTIDWGLGNMFYFTFGSQNDAFTFTAPPGSAKCTLFMKQDGVGSRTMDWSGVTILWPGDVEPTLSTGANAVDILLLIWDGTSWHGLFNGDFR